MEAAVVDTDLTMNPSLHDYDDNNNNNEAEKDTERVESWLMVRSEQGQGWSQARGQSLARLGIGRISWRTIFSVSGETDTIRD